MLESRAALVRELFGSPPPGAGNNQRLSAASVSAGFRRHLGELLAKLEAIGSHLVRCLKPNSKVVALWCRRARPKAHECIFGCLSSR